MTRQFRLYGMALTTAAAILASSLGQQAVFAKDIVETAVSAGSFTNLAAALKAAGLVDALQGEGPFTVFAPTDDAFAKLPSGTVENLLKPENKKQLAAVLTYHVVKGRVPASKVVSLAGAETLNGQRVDIAVRDGKVTVDEANVVKTDIECSNGIIHVIDSVILPQTENIPTVASQAGKFGTLLAAVKAAGLVDALSSEGPFTVLAPTDAAFGKLPAGTVESLLKPENKDKLAAVLKYHVVPGRVYSEAALKAKSAKTLQGQSIRISAKGDSAKINDARLIATDIDASNGVIHVIDSVLIPSDGENVSVHEARKMIEHAISRGARLYNAGHHESCAQIYTETVAKMVDGGRTMPPQVMATLQQTLSDTQHTHCATQRSWTLRRGLDRAYYAMSSSAK